MTYRYDAFDRRIAKEIDLPGGNGPSVPTGSAIDQAEYFVYDGEDIALVYDEASSLTHRYLHGPGIDNALADEVFTTSAYDDTYWLLPDHQGTIRDVVDNDVISGTATTFVVEHVIVDAFGFIADVKDGNGISKSTDVPMVMYVYSGMVYDDETGLYQVRHRYYDPENGVFISKDPIGFEGGDYNLYRWVGNDAVNGVDPWGLEKVSGPFVWLYTGHWTVEKNVYDAAIGGAAETLETELPKAHSRLETLAVIDPTGLAECTNGALYAAEGKGDEAWEHLQNGTMNIGANKLGGFKPKGAGAGSKTDSVVDASKTVDAGKPAKRTVTDNKRIGDAHENEVKTQMQETHTNIASQVTIKTESGVKTKVDLVGKEIDSGSISLRECKSSDTARLTKNQKKAFPEIESTGGTVVGKGKQGYPGGTVIPPTKVEIIRPEKPK